MKNNPIQTVSIDDFEFNILLKTDDFVVINKVGNIPNSPKEIKLNCFLFVFCLEGEMQLDLNNKAYQLKANNLLVGLPNMTIGHALVSPHHEVRIIAFEPKFLQRIVKPERENMDLFLYLCNHPIIEVGSDSVDDAWLLYRNLFFSRIESDLQYYKKEILQYLFSAFFYEILSFIKRSTPDMEKKVKDADQSLKRADHIFRRFLEKLASDNGTHRSVQYYANELFYTSKYLSKVVKEVSGRTPLEFINEHTIGLISHQLKHTDKTISEIADEFEFATLSFFGKYVKAHLGMSPLNYRKTKTE